MIGSQTCRNCNFANRNKNKLKISFLLFPPILIFVLIMNGNTMYFILIFIVSFIQRFSEKKSTKKLIKKGLNVKNQTNYIPTCNSQEYWNCEC